MKKVLWAALFVLAVFGLGATGQQEEKFPSQPVTIIVPWAPGGLKPVLFEMIKPLLSAELGVPVVVVNKPGGGGAVGWKELQVAKADGYTIGAASNSIFGATFVTKGDVDWRNFAPVVSLSADNMALTVNVDSPWKTFPEFFEHVKANPGKVRVGNSGAGGIWHIAALAFNQAAGVELLPVPFAGGGPAVTALLGGHIEATSVTPGDMTAVLPTGKLRILAIAAPTRNPFYPDVPTIKEAIGTEVVVRNWSGVVAPKGTPAERIAVLAEAFGKVVQDKTYLEFLEKNRLTNDFMDNEQFRAAYEADAQSMTRILESLEGLNK